MLSRFKSLLPGKSSSPSDASAASKREGDEHLKRDRLDDAVVCYRRAVSQNPSYVDALVGLGFALSAQKQFDEAAQCLQRALTIDPTIADAHYILGTNARDSNDDAGSIDHFARAIDVKPDFEYAYRDLFAALVRNREVAKAKEVLVRAVSRFPQSAEFQVHLGNVLSHEGDHDNAVACYEKALSIRPDFAESHKYLADVLAQTGKLEQAAGSYQKATWFDPALVDAHLGLGSVKQRQELLDEAIACYRRAVELEPEHASANLSLGNLLQGKGQLDEAVVCFRRAIATDPTLPAAHQYLGNALLDQGATKEAVACFEEVLRLDPANPVKHVIAALSGRDSERAPSEYVEQLFDQYAQRFDSHLVDVLKYSVPEKLAELLHPHSEPGAAKWSVLDLGCGTGLSGAAIAQYAKHLVGVDLSAKMLDKARERKLYHRLEQRDLLTMMQGEPESTFDLVFSADVFVYLGALDDLMGEAYRLLRPGGHLAFSVESLDALAGGAAISSDSHDYRLNVTGRYAHSMAYLSRMAAHNGFEVLGTTDTQSRLDKGVPVEAYLSLWRRPRGG